MYTIAFDFPNLPKGGEIDITGLDTIFENGKTYTISKEAAQAFRVANQHPVVPASQQNPDVATKWELGQTLLEAFKDNEHVKVTVTKEADK